MRIVKSILAAFFLLSGAVVLGFTGASAVTSRSNTLSAFFSQLNDFGGIYGVIFLCTGAILLCMPRSAK